LLFTAPTTGLLHSRGRTRGPRPVRGAAKGGGRERRKAGEGAWVGGQAECPRSEQGLHCRGGGGGGERAVRRFVRRSQNGAECVVRVRCRPWAHMRARLLLLTVGLAELLEIGDGLGRESGEGVGDEHKNRLVPTLGLRHRTGARTRTHMHMQRSTTARCPRWRPLGQLKGKRVLGRHRFRRPSSGPPSCRRPACRRICNRRTAVSPANNDQRKLAERKRTCARRSAHRPDQGQI
jgi:hypothetical protein